MYKVPLRDVVGLKVSGVPQIKTNVCVVGIHVGNE